MQVVKRWGCHEGDFPCTGQPCLESAPFWMCLQVPIHPAPEATSLAGQGQCCIAMFCCASGIAFVDEKGYCSPDLYLLLALSLIAHMLGPLPTLIR